MLLSLTDKRSFVMRKTPRLKNTSREIDSSELSRASGGGNLSVGNLLLSVGVSFDSQSNIATALQLGPR
jgi:hypothetical protein